PLHGLRSGIALHAVRIAQQGRSAHIHARAGVMMFIHNPDLSYGFLLQQRGVFRGVLMRFMVQPPGAGYASPFLMMPCTAAWSAARHPGSGASRSAASP